MPQGPRNVNGNDPKSLDSWTQCPPGTLTQMNRRIRSARHTKQALFASASLALALVVGIGLWTFVMPPRSDQAIVTCNDVQSGLRQYIRGELTPEIRNLFAMHIAECVPCERKFTAMRERMAAEQAGAVPSRPSQLGPKSIETALLAEHFAIVASR